jgi:hypothetical protein
MICFFAGKTGSEDCTNLMLDFEYVSKDMNIPINDDKIQMALIQSLVI